MLGLTDRPEEQANAELLSRHGSGGDPGQHHRCRALPPGGRGAPPTSSTLPWPCGRAARATSSSSRSTSTAPATCSRRPAAERVERFVYCSTIGIYGHRAPGITREESPLSPGNIYERTKVAAERLVRDFAENCGLPAVVLRPADVYGPRDQRLLKMFKGVSRGRFPLFGVGEGPPPHGVRGRRRLRLLPRPASGTRRWGKG